jgi:transposase-like protein
VAVALGQPAPPPPGLDGDEEGGPPRPQKSQAAFRTISEVADELDVAQHVLRFWESKFPQVRPLKRGGGRRYYRPEDVDLLRQIRALLYDEGYTIRGAQKLLRARRA